MTMDEMQGGETHTNQPSLQEGGTLMAVSALMGERRRFEGWISALEARRASTPEHVFKRVHADYSGRLEAVIINLTTHTDGLRREMDALSSRLSVIHDERQRAEDERSEAELRAHVGELSGEDWQSTKSKSDAALSDLAGRHGEVEQELQKTRDLLEAAQRPVTPATSHPAEPEPVAPPVPATPEPEPAPAPVAAAPPPAAESVQAPAAAAAKPAEAVEALAAPPTSVPRSSPLRVIHQTPYQGMLPIEQQPIDDDESSAAPSSRSASRKSSFDELAFLSSVVDAPSGSIEPAPTDQADEKTRRDTFAVRDGDESVSNLTDKDSSPLASQSAEHLPTVESALARSRMDAMVGRDSLVDGAKTLKCSECSAMNYPTEWYCERCGAELASL
ncbi:MAG: Ran-binding zinc finger domain-containing protein [bacterium]